MSIGMAGGISRSHFKGGQEPKLRKHISGEEMKSAAAGVIIIDGYHFIKAIGKST